MEVWRPWRKVCLAACPPFFFVNYKWVLVWVVMTQCDTLSRLGFLRTGHPPLEE